MSHGAQPWAPTSCSLRWRRVCPRGRDGEKAGNTFRDLTSAEGPRLMFMVIAMGNVDALCAGLCAKLSGRVAAPRP